MIVTMALALVLAPEEARQKLAGSAFEAFAARTEAICPARQLRFVTPGDLDWYQEDFVAQLPRPARHQLARADVGPQRCAHRDGLACPTTAALEAMATTGLLAAFAAFACTDPPPVDTTTADPARTHNPATRLPSASPAAVPMR